MRTEPRAGNPNERRYRVAVPAATITALAVVSCVAAAAADTVSGPRSAAAAGAWGGGGCAAKAELTAIVENALAAIPAATAFPGRGLGAPGYSAAVFHENCGLFAHAAGRRHIAGDLAMLPRPVCMSAA